MKKPGQRTYQDRSLKKCNTCNKDETEVEFYLRYRSVCKKCHNEKSNKYRTRMNAKLKERYW